MATTTPTANCASCGGKLILNFKNDINKCEYCGNEYYAAADGKDETFTGYLPFAVSATAFKGQVMDWLTDGDLTPADILTPRTPFKIEARYVPTYMFAGEYKGAYTLLNKDGEPIGDNIPLNGQYEVFCYAGFHADAGQDIIETNLIAVNTAAAIPLSEALESNPVWAATTEATTVWGKAGNLRASQQVLQQLKNADSTKNYRPAVEYRTKKISLLYLPFYYMPYNYAGQNYLVIANGQNGEIFGERPTDHYFKMPTRWGTFWKRFALGWLQWFAIVAVYVMVVGIENLAMEKNMENATRAVSFVITFVVPIAMATFLFGYVKRSALNKLKKTRKQSMQMILNGGRPSPFA